MAINAEALRKLSTEQLAARWDMIEIREQTYTDSIGSVLEARGKIAPIVAGLEECLDRRELIQTIVNERVAFSNGWGAWAKHNCLGLGASVLTGLGAIAANVYEGIEAGTDNQTSTKGIISAAVGAATTLTVIWCVSKLTTKRDGQKAENVALARINNELLTKVESIRKTVRAFQMLAKQTTNAEEANERLAAAAGLPLSVKESVSEEMCQAYAVDTDQLTQQLVMSPFEDERKDVPGALSPQSQLQYLRQVYRTWKSDTAHAVMRQEHLVSDAPSFGSALISRASASPRQVRLVDTSLAARLDQASGRLAERAGPPSDSDEGSQV